METSASVLMSNMELLYENIYNLLIGFQKATNTNLNDISVPLKNKSGLIENLKINSFQKLLNECTRIDNNFKSITNADNIAYTVNGDGSISQFSKTSFINAEYLSNFKFGLTAEDTDADAFCIVDKASMIKNMVFPNVKIPIYLNNTIKSQIRCRYYEIVDGFENIQASPTLLDIQYLIQQGIIGALEDEIVLEIEKEKVKFFGQFTVIDVATSGNNSTLTLSDIAYSSVNSIGTSIDLKVGDMLVVKSGSAKFQIAEIDLFTKVVKVIRVSGSDTIKVGINELLFNEVLPTNNNIVGIPVQPNKKFVIFLSTENLKNISYPSVGIKLDTNTYQVKYENETYTLDEYFSKYVTNFSEYILALTKETNIPLSLGVKPQTVVLDPINFKVIQINKHLTTAKSTSEIEALNQKKLKIKNDIELKSTEITLVQNEIDTQKFKTVNEKSYRIGKIETLRGEINTLNQNLLIVSRDLNNGATESGLKELKPKYRVIGFWPIQSPIYSPLTKPQNIIKYDIQYRYLSKNSDTVDSTSIKMITEGKEVNVVFSSWNELQTRTLNKVANIDGTISWEIPLLESVSDININQINVAIQEGEAIEFKVRAISEAGYPVAPLSSEWSETLRIDFPNNLTDSNINTIVAKNEDDLRLSEFNNILQVSGILKHISGQIQEAERTFWHKSNDIASGFFTNEQKTIDLHTFLTTIKNDIQLLQNRDVLSNLVIEVVDFKNETYVVKNNTTIELSAGNYSDSLNLLDNTKWGSIIRKQGFIKIKNNNTIPIELKTLVPGTIFDNTSAGSYYNVPVKTPTALIQASKQILFFRNIDITNQNEDLFRLVKPKLSNSNTNPNSLYIDPLAIEDDKNIVYYDVDNNVKICKLTANAGTDFVSFTKEHPMYDTDNKDLMIPEFNRLTTYTQQLKELHAQAEKTDVDSIGLGFNDNDFYAVGQNTCGAFLYPIINNPNNISVIGNNTISTLIIQSQSEILVPFLYEFRMIDRIGKVNGLLNTTINDNLSYSKKIGIDMLINNELFKFDINVSSKLKSNVAPIESLNVSSVVGLFGSESPETII